MYKKIAFEEARMHKYLYTYLLIFKQLKFIHTIIKKST